MKAQPTRIVAIDGNHLTVAVDAPEACGGCRSKAACGTGDGSTHQIEVAADLASRLRTGDRVSVMIADGATMRAIAAAYLLPLGGLLAGVAAGSALVLPDMAIVLCGSSGLFSGHLGSRVLARHWRTHLQPQVCQGGGTT
ncbi:SoxR reducing system RseC family protein [Methyloversatilis sp.]|uniref:SoxR reducing system RseC family protein n=1 Tax=Methyloversatilis sp. TaxID=2569862 RepID=UPI0027361656|nr:SoxR reducing system RseC family protein [Methyloversatilis sp.]MDP2869069.1 SoxR reducing system RseC family protein [Methyloversatilis sp.]MDP3286993.1 SoxR reducing system RseC family protein [Methyloversatilis sp.]MDP3453892.1 SoxR reducing system RseC family protein [Methyloversatilis sp.]MDP3579026.1 SoxR reducing system RseC family protein [Methyloversatilis sp.]